MMEKVKICVPITGRNQEEIEQQAHAIAATEADVAEWRFDLARDLYVGQDWTRTLPTILEMLHTVLHGKELLFTIRTEQQGGSFPVDASAYREIALHAIASSCLNYLDLEDTTEEADACAILAEAHKKGVQVIASYHDFEKTPAVEEILTKLRALRAMGADILKTAYMPNRTSDVAALLLATARFREEDVGKHPLITMSMGELGKISRLVGGAFGSMLTFATVGEASAPGQMPIEEVRKSLDTLYTIHSFDCQKP